MSYIFLGAALLLGLIWLSRFVLKGNARSVVRSLRWVIGGGLGLLAGFFLIRGRIEIASVAAAVAFSILRYDRVGPFRFESAEPSGENTSAVRSRYIAMTLDHSSGAVSGKVIYGEFQGLDLIDLGEDETRRLLGAVSHDPDSLALLETWLDRNRAGWREYFERTEKQDQPDDSGDDAEWYDVLGLKPGATAAEIRAAHRGLMKGVHPDQGGSTFLASKINEAKDRLLKKVKG